MKIVAVCGLGMGTSLILKMSIKTVLNKYGKRAEIEHCDVSVVSQVQADFIITSSDLLPLIKNAAPKICIKNFVDINEIETALKEHEII